MIDWLDLGLPLGAGVVLGAVFFGGLWWTVRRAVSSRWVVPWFFASMLLRTVLVVAGLYWACGGDWRRWLAGLLGFTLARLVVTRLTRAPEPVGSPAPEVGHAP